MSEGARTTAPRQIVKSCAGFSWQRPPFGTALGDYYHRFHLPLPSSSSAAAAAATTDAGEDFDEAVVQRMALKRKRPYREYDTAASTEFSMPNSGSIQGVGSPEMTPISEKRTTPRNTKAGPQTHTFNAGSPSNPPTPAGSSRHDSSLELLTKKFMNVLKEAEDGVLDLNNIADKLQAKKRRLYDITNVLEGIDLMEKTSKNIICWKYLDKMGPKNLDDGLSPLKADLENLNQQEQILDEHTSKIKEKLKDLTEDENNQRWLFHTEEDIKGLPCYQMTSDCLQGRYRLVLESTMGPIDLSLVSKTEEKMEGKPNDAAAPAEHTNVENEKDYLLLTNYDASVTDIWTTEQIQLDQIEANDSSAGMQLDQMDANAFLVDMHLDHLDPNFFLAELDEIDPPEQ